MRRKAKGEEKHALGQTAVKLSQAEFGHNIQGSKVCPGIHSAPDSM
jgi:hypothetical protein